MLYINEREINTFTYIFGLNLKWVIEKYKNILGLTRVQQIVEFVRGFFLEGGGSVV